MKGLSSWYREVSKSDSAFNYVKTQPDVAYDLDQVLTDSESAASLTLDLILSTPRSKKTCPGPKPQSLW